MMKMMTRLMTMKKETAQRWSWSRSLVTTLRQMSKQGHMVMMSTIRWTKRFTRKLTGKVEANRISTRPSSTRGNNNNTTNSSKTRGDTCNNKVDPRHTEVLTQISKLIMWDLKPTMHSIKVRDNMLETLVKGKTVDNLTSNKHSIINKIIKHPMHSSSKTWTNKTFLKMIQTFSNSWVVFQVCRTCLTCRMAKDRVKQCQGCKGCLRWTKGRARIEEWVETRTSSKTLRTSSICQVSWVTFKTCSTISRRIMVCKWTLMETLSTRGKEEMQLTSNRTSNTPLAIKEAINSSSSTGCQLVNTTWI